MLILKFELHTILARNYSFYFLIEFNIRLFCLITVFTIFIMFFFFSQDCSLPQILHLWLDSDFYLPSSETPPSSRQTVVAEQIKAPPVY